MNELTELLTKTPNPNTGKTRAASTSKNYILNVNKLAKALTSHGVALNNLEFLKDHAQVTAYIHANYKIKTQKNYFIAVSALLQSIKDDSYIPANSAYLSEITHLVEQINNTEVLQEKSATQAQNWTTFKKLQKVPRDYHKYLNGKGVFKKTYEDLSVNEKKILKYWLISSLYTSDGNPPVRANYAPMKIITNTKYDSLSEEEKHHNYLILSKKSKMFYFGLFKNVSYHGAQTVSVAKKLNTVLNKYLKMFKEPPEYLIQSVGSKPVDGISLAANMHKVFEPTGKHITINLLRHVYVTENLSGPFLDEKKEMADKMMHDVSMQDKYRVK